MLGTLGITPAMVDGHRIFYTTKTGVFSVSKPINGEPATAANGGTIGFACSSTNKPTCGMPLASPMAGPHVKTLRACAKSERAKSMSPIYVISMATSSAPCTGWAEDPTR